MVTLTVAQFLSFHEDEDAVHEGKNVHPMNILDLPLEHHLHQQGIADAPLVGSVVQLPTELTQRTSLGHVFEKLLLSPTATTSLDFTKAHSKYLLLSEKGAKTDWHEEMTGSSVFYMLLAGSYSFICSKRCILFVTKTSLR